MGYYRSGKAIYFTNTSGAGNTDQVLIADCESEEKAHFLLDAITTHSSNFIRDALVTCSHEFHGDMVAKNQFTGRLNGAIDALNKLDAVKKTLFYGRDNNLIAEGQRDASYIVSNFGGNDAAIPSNVAADIIHGIIGFATEAGELLEALKDAINGKPLDWVNVQEELGDSSWYAAILANAGDFTFEEFEQRIIMKLRQRYADKFTASEAVERNLAAERAILEDRAAPFEKLSIEPADPLDDSPRTTVDEANSVEANMVDAPVTKGTRGGELHLSPAARSRALPGEHLAHQRVRREDESR